MYRAIFFVKCKHTINTYNVHVIFEFRLQVLRTIFFCSIGSVVFLFTYLLKQHTGPCPLWHCNHVTIDQSQASFFPAFPTKSDGFWRNVWSTCSTVVLLGTVCEVFFFGFGFFFVVFFFSESLSLSAISLRSAFMKFEAFLKKNSTVACYLSVFTRLGMTTDDLCHSKISKSYANIVRLPASPHNSLCGFSVSIIAASAFRIKW